MEIPETFTEGDKAILLKTLQTSGFTMAMGWLVNRHHFGLKEAKLIVHHLPIREGICARCGRELLDEGETLCPVCNSLNFNWQAN